MAAWRRLGIVWVLRPGSPPRICPAGETAYHAGVDVLLAFPQLVFALLLVSVLGPTWLLVLAVGLSHAPQVARVIRSTALDVSERDYVKAVEITGVRPSKVMSREILPNLITPLMVETGLRLTYSIIIMAGLAFIGFGFQPPEPELGLHDQGEPDRCDAEPLGGGRPAILIALLDDGVNTFTDAVARVALGVDRAEKAIAEAAGSGTVTTRPDGRESRTAVGWSSST